MNRYVRAVIAVGLLLVFAAPTPAAADALWPESADCAVGEFTGQVTGPADEFGPFLELSGWVGPCPPNDKDPEPQVRGRFGFAYLDSGIADGQHLVRGSISDFRLRPYQSATGPTTFAGRFNFDTVGVDDAEAAICLMRDVTTRLACAVVRWDTDVPTATWIAVTDPRVRGRVTVYHPGGTPTPNCGTCL